MPVFISSLWLVQFLDHLLEFEWDEGNKEKNRIRVISARVATKNEREKYEQQKEN